MVVLFVFFWAGCGAAVPQTETRHLVAPRPFGFLKHLTPLVSQVPELWTLATINLFDPVNKWPC